MTTCATELDRRAVRTWTSGRLIFCELSDGRRVSRADGATLHAPELDVESIQGDAMIHKFDVVVERDSEDYFVASVAALPGCHTQAKSLDELMARIREAIELCVEVQGMPESLEFVGVQRITIEA